MFDGEAAAYDAIMSGEVSILQYITVYYTERLVYYTDITLRG